MATISAVKDREIIRVSYQYSPPPGNSELADVTFILLHRYKDSNGTLNQIILDSQVVGKAFFKIDGQPQANVSAPQMCEVSFVNSRYAKDLVVRVEEVRNGSPISKEVSVLDGFQPAVQDLPSNPIKIPEQQENLPPKPQVKPIDNVVVSDPAVTPIVYSLDSDGLELVQSGERIVYDEINGFRKIPAGQASDTIYSENGLRNLLPNPLFTGPGNVPQHYSIVGPGLILTTRLKNQQVAGTRSMEMRCQNPNFLNAFNSLIIKTDRFTIPQGIPILTFSSYYKLTLTDTANPIAECEVKCEFFDSGNTFLGAISRPLTFVNQTRPTYWGRVSATLENVPLNASAMQVSIICGPIESSDIFTLEIYLPQVEPYSKASSFAVGNRIQDQFTSTRPVHLKSPFYAMLDTVHTTHKGVRGLMDSTSNGTNGVQWAVSGNVMNFRVLDPSGTVLSQAISSTISKADGDAVRYGVAVQGSNLNFYIDEALLSTHPISSVNYSSLIKVGSLFNSNTALNSEISDFRITTLIP